MLRLVDPLIYVLKMLRDNGGVKSVVNHIVLQWSPMISAGIGIGITDRDEPIAGALGLAHLADV